MFGERKEHKWRSPNEITQDYRSLQEVRITRDLGSLRHQEIIDFINKHIAEFNGYKEESHGIPLMLFERKEDAHKFADELRKKLDIQKEHIEVKASKFKR